jgi:hypothetical protein
MREAPGRHRRVFAFGIALVATLACAGTTASAAPVKVAPGLTVGGVQLVGYTAPATVADQTTMPNASEYRSVVSLRLSAAVNRSVRRSCWSHLTAGPAP